MTRAALSLCVAAALASGVAACGDDDEKTVIQTVTQPQTGTIDETAERTETTPPQDEPGADTSSSGGELTSCETAPPDGAGVFDVRQSGFSCDGIDDFVSNWMSTCASAPEGDSCSLGEFDCTYASTGEEVGEVTCAGSETPSGQVKVVFKVGA